ncbi:hypothetical protein ACIUXQ_32905 [Pseudomonas aeruginosa]
MSNELTDVRCPCGAEFQADSYDAGFIAGSGMCQNCDAALPPKDICTCPSGDGSLRHPCPAHPESVELAGVTANLTFINGRPAMCGCQVEYSSGGGEYSDVIYVTLCAKHSGSAILDLVATNRIALTPEYEGQWHADLYLDREIPLAKAEGATPAEAVLALMSAERIDPEQESVEQAGGDERAGLRAAAKWHREQRNAFEAEAEMHRQRYENTNRPDSLTAEAEHHRRLWETASAMAANHLDYAAGFEEMARAALAQPSPESDLDPFNLAPHAKTFNEAPAEALKPEQAEAERPEVVASSAAADIVGDVCDLDPDDDGPDCVRVNVKDLLRICERHIVGVAQELGNHKARADRFLRLLHDEKKRTDKASSTSYAAGVDDAEHGKVGGKWRTRLFDEATNRANDLGYEGVLDALGDLKKTTQRLHEVAVTCATAEQERDAALARVAELDKQCRDDVARALGLRPSQERGFAWSYLLASIKSCVKASEDAAQAQHSVPEGWRDMLAELQWHYEPYDDHYHTPQGFYCPVCGGEKDEGHKQGCNLAELLAAAPGKEGV